MAEIISTYRLQLHAGFPLPAARAIVPYLSRLGVTHIHASPILQARSGSTHGYDVVDPTRLDRALGTEDDLDALQRDLRERGMGLVLDIVPNHMAASNENPAWEDVLTHGQASPFARWFDIDWRTADRGTWSRVLLPVLGEARNEVLERDQIRLVCRGGGIRAEYFDHSWPLDPSALPPVLTAARVAVERILGSGHAAASELDAITALLRRTPRRSTHGAAALARRRERSASALARLATLAGSDPEAGRVMEQAVAAYGRGPEGRLRLRRLLDAQVYRLVHWRRAAREINYRRFFDVNDLVALHMEDPEVFAQTHSLVLEWWRRGWLDGFRIDHPDGLLDPLRYFRALAATVHESGRSVWVEKILSYNEALRRSWPVAGTTGYDFLNQAERLFLSPEGMNRLEREYRRIVRRPLGFSAVAAEAKRMVLESALAAGVRALARRLLLLVSPAAAAGVPRHAAIRAIAEVMVCLHVYRTYVDERPDGVTEEDVRLLRGALAGARDRGRATPAALDLVEAALLGDPAIIGRDAEPRHRRFVQRFQQLSGPATAKGIEDTAFYRYAALFSTNEVGGEPEAVLADAVAEFHAANEERAACWPAAMLTVTTHDTKRTADVRARLDVLSEIPDEWARLVARWRRLNLAHKRTVRGRRAPDPNSVYQFLQAMVGMWPETPPTAEELAPLRERLVAYSIKAAREAKERTSWTDPDGEFEAALAGSIEALLSPEQSGPFLDNLQRFTRRIAAAGRWNSLSRTLLQLTSPGTPDIYQGDELWTHALVDPDNRRPVDFEKRRALLEELERCFGADQDSRDCFLTGLMHSPADGRIKLHVVHRALHARRQRRELRDGTYEPLRAVGKSAFNVVAFGRSLAGSCAVIAAPRLIARRLLDERRLPTDPAIWAETEITLPAAWPRRWTCTLSQAAITAGSGGALDCAGLFSRLPVALLLGESER